MALLGCEVQIAGTVVDVHDAPVAGAVVADQGCTAVTHADGTFASRCAREKYEFSVSHPTHAVGGVALDATGALAPAPVRVVLTPWPGTVGWYRNRDFAPLAASSLTRTIEATEQRFCLPTPPPAQPPGSFVVFEVGSQPWRALALDADGCAYRLKKAEGSSWWSPVETRVAEVAREPLAEGRARVTLELPGPTVLVPWYEGFFVPDDPTADTWLAWLAA